MRALKAIALSLALAVLPTVAVAGGMSNSTGGGGLPAGMTFSGQTLTIMGDATHPARIEAVGGNVDIIEKVFDYWTLDGQTVQIGIDGDNVGVKAIEFKGGQAQFIKGDTMIFKVDEGDFNMVLGHNIGIKDEDGNALLKQWGLNLKFRDPLATAPGLEHGYLQFEAGTTAGTLKLVLYAGTSTTGATVIDNIGIATGVTDAGAARATLPAVTGSIGGSQLVAGACASTTVGVTGATTSMTVSTTPNTYPGDGAFFFGYVSSANTVTVKVCESVLGTPTASTYNVRVHP